MNNESLASHSPIHSTHDVQVNSEQQRCKICDMQRETGATACIPLRLGGQRKTSLSAEDQDLSLRSEIQVEDHVVPLLRCLG